MLTLVFFGAALICLILAPFCRSEPTEYELEDDEKMKSLMRLPSIVGVIAGVFFKIRGIDNPPPKKSAFGFLVILSVLFILIGLAAAGFAPSGTQK